MLNSPIYSNLGARKNPVSITVVLPSSILESEPTGLQRALKISRIARTLSIFRVDRVIVYRWGRNKWLFREACDLLEYAVRPPYLKKYIPVKKTLKHAGVMEPLNIWIHRVSRDLRKHPIRLAQVVRLVGDKVEVDVGIDRFFQLNIVGPEKPSLGDVVLVKVSPEANEAILYQDKSLYLGYTVGCADTLKKLATLVKNGFQLGFSRKGEPIDSLSSDIYAKGELVIYLGGPRFDIFRVYRGVTFDGIANVYPEQGTETIRTEEALCIGLSRLPQVRSGLK